MYTVEKTHLKAEFHFFWQQFEHAYWNNRLAHAYLLRGPVPYLEVLYKHMIAIMLCKQPKGPCQTCKSCNLVIQGQHPDLHLITPEKTGSIIKVEQVREVQSSLYTAPQLAGNKIVLIQYAEKMNQSAANSLLKILEEPPPGVYFILIAETITTIPATIFSRCQHWYFPEFNHFDGTYLAESPLAEPNSALGKLFQQSEYLINDLLAIKKEKASIVTIAEKWSAYDLPDLVRFIYLITAQMIHNDVHTRYPQSALSFKLEELTTGFKLTDLFLLLDKLNHIMKNLSYSINVNQLLTLENILLSFCEN